LPSAPGTQAATSEPSVVATRPKIWQVPFMPPNAPPPEVRSFVVVAITLPDWRSSARIVMLFAPEYAPPPTPTTLTMVTLRSLPFPALSPCWSFLLPGCFLLTLSSTQSPTIVSSAQSRLTASTTWILGSSTA